MNKNSNTSTTSSQSSTGQVWDKVYQRLVPVNKAVCPISNKTK